jgi:hypothetical protein
VLNELLLDLKNTKKEALISNSFEGSEVHYRDFVQEDFIECAKMGRFFPGFLARFLHIRYK